MRDDLANSVAALGDAANVKSPLRNLIDTVVESIPPRYVQLRAELHERCVSLQEHAALLALSENWTGSAEELLATIQELCRPLS